MTDPQPTARLHGRYGLGRLATVATLVATAALSLPTAAQAVTDPAGASTSSGRVSANVVATRPTVMRTYWPVVVTRPPRNTHDLPVPVGTPVRAIRDGIVVGSYDIRGYEPRIRVQNGYRSYGRVVKIRHPGTPGVLTYAHLHARVAKTGDRVRAGQLIGYSGATGHAFGPHLHIDFDGVENAVPWLAKARALPPKSPWLR